MKRPTIDWVLRALFDWGGPILCLSGVVHAWLTGQMLAAYWAAVALFACVYVALDSLRRRKLSEREPPARLFPSPPEGVDLVERLQLLADRIHPPDSYARVTMLEAAEHIRRLRKRFGT